jgi:AhpD family alkylhydroperoxidase
MDDPRMNPPRRPRAEWKDYIEWAPDANAALLGLGKAVDVSGFEKSLIELVKLRCSQINGCAHCVQWHTEAARKAGVSETRLQLLVAWRDAPADLYSAREEAALAWAERLTLVADGGVSDEDYAAVSCHFEPKALAYLTACVVAINAWNRISVAYRFTPPGLAG